MSLLLGHIDGRRCLESALLLLNPDELKNCRLVSSTLNEFIMEELWGNKAGREKLRKKLVEGWRNGEARMVMIGKAKDELEGIFCSNQFVFCGLENRLGQRNDISMHGLPSGNWIKDLKLAPRPNLVLDDHWSHSTEVVGSKDLVTAVLWGRIVVFWEVKEGEMVQLEPLYLGNQRCWKGVVQVCGTKAAILARPRPHGRFGPNQGMSSLILMEKGTSGWESKTLTELTLYAGGLPAINGDFIALAKDVYSEHLLLPSELADTRISLWCGDKELPDVLLPGRMGQTVTGIILEVPFVILSLVTRLQTIGSMLSKSMDATIKVYSVSTSNRMEEISSQGSLLKNIPITGDRGELVGDNTRLIFNDFIIGHVQQPQDGDEVSVHIMDKKLLLNPKVPAKDVWVREIKLPHDCNVVDINNTSLVCSRDGATREPLGEGQWGVAWTADCAKKGELHMINFWMKPVEKGE